ncbi:MAG: hypothetical protein KDA20_09505 [Phycisphaerales bacterium]|nr:hypothetical protein [Phycisphaerales bacterium]
MPRQRRQHLIAQYLRTHQVTSQEELALALANAGEIATQATISRDLAALGALKGPGGYLVPEAPTAAPSTGREPSALEATLRRHAVWVRQADALVVIRTAPGHASLVGDVLDRAMPKGGVGTIAGDDTVFLATTSKTAAGKLTRHLHAALLES